MKQMFLKDIIPKGVICTLDTVRVNYEHFVSRDAIVLSVSTSLLLLLLNCDSAFPIYLLY